MISKPLENPIIAVSVKVYQVLLAVYPARFRKEYGSHMLQVFRDCCLRAFRQSGKNGMFKLWALTLFDLLRSSIEEHLQKETFMTRSKFIRLGGWSLMLGAVSLFLSILSAYIDSIPYGPLWRIRPFYMAVSELGFWMTPILLAVGMLGLRTRYGEETGNLGKNILLIGAIAGPVITLLGFIGAEVFDWGWILPFTGTAVLLACLSIFGIPALSAKSLPRWNSLPILAGICYPFLVILVVIFEAIGLSQNWIDGLADPAYIAIPLQCILLFILGFMLQADVPEEIPATA